MTALTQTTQTKEIEEVKRVLKDFHRSVDMLLDGNPEPMYGLWSHKEDTVNMGPFAQMNKGWDAIRQELERQSKLKMGSGQPFQRRDEEVLMGSDMAVTYGYVSGQMKDPQGRQHTIQIRESLVFNKENGQWKIVGIHVDRLPFEA